MNGDMDASDSGSNDQEEAENGTKTVVVATTASKSEASVSVANVEGDYGTLFFNDSNSDDTQFDINGGTPSQRSPIKSEEDGGDNHVFMRNLGFAETRSRQSTGSDSGQGEERDFAQAVVSHDISENGRSVALGAILDDFLGEDDLIQELDSYSQSVSQTRELYPKGNDGVPLLSPHGQTAIELEWSEAGTIGSVERRTSYSGVEQVSRDDSKAKGTNKKGKNRSFVGTKKNSGSGAVGKRSEKRKPRTYSQAVPSQHCHICSRRPTENSPHAVCGNLLKGRCRKTICTKCFHQFRWDLKAAREAAPGTWECPHCRGVCPQRAQCVIYNRTSDRRRMKLINHRKRKDAELNNRTMQTHGTPIQIVSEARSASPDSGRTGFGVVRHSNGYVTNNDVQHGMGHNFNGSEMGTEAIARLAQGQGESDVEMVGMMCSGDGGLEMVRNTVVKSRRNSESKDGEMIGFIDLESGLNVIPTESSMDMRKTDNEVDLGDIAVGFTDDVNVDIEEVLTGRSEVMGISSNVLGGEIGESIGMMTPADMSFMFEGVGENVGGIRAVEEVEEQTSTMFWDEESAVEMAGNENEEKLSDMVAQNLDVLL